MPFLLRAQPARNAVQRAVAVQRNFSYAPQMRLKEDKQQSAQEIEQAKKEQLKTGEKKEELESASETAIKADVSNKEPEQLQKETTAQAQKEHAEGK